MSGLRESNFRRIYIALKADFILTIILPLVFFVLLFILDQQLRRAGLNSNDIDLKEINHVSGFLPELLYAYLVSSFCASGICSMLAVSGLSEAENCSLWLRRSRKWFTGCMLMNAVAMAVRIVHISFNQSGYTGFLLSLYPTVQGFTLALHGGAVHALMKGYGDVLESIGDQKSSLRIRSFSKWITISYSAFLAAYIAFMTDLYPGNESFGLVLLLLALFVLTLFFWLIVRYKALRYARMTWLTLADISDKVIQ